MFFSAGKMRLIRFYPRGKERGERGEAFCLGGENKKKIKREKKKSKKKCKKTIIK